MRTWLTDEFAVRYYRWALDDARREVSENFRLLRPIKASLVLRAIAFLESFPGEDRARVAAALVKRFHRRAVELTGEPWGPDEEGIERDYLEAARIWRPEEDNAFYRVPEDLAVLAARLVGLRPTSPVTAPASTPRTSPRR